MAQVAMSWLVYRLTHSAFLLGLVSFSTLIPAFFLTPFAGVLADRWDRKKILVVTQTLSMLEALVMAYLTLTHQVQVWQIITLGFILGVINSVDIPARQAFMVMLVEKKDDLPNAIGLNSTLFNAARLIGPAIAGFVIAAVGEGLCFLINGVSFLAVIAALLAMKIEDRVVRPGNMASGWRHLKEGIHYIRGFPPIAGILLYIAFVSFFGFSYTVLMPIFATSVLQGGPHQLGFLMGSSGCGALGGAFYLASRKSVRGLMRLMVWTGLFFGASVAAFSLSVQLWSSMLFLVISGFSMMVQMGGGNIILQTVVDEDKRGRVMSFYAMSLMGVSPFGSLLAGWVAKNFGAAPTVFWSGLVCVVGAVIFATQYERIREHIRPVYRRMGIIPSEMVPPSEP
jgi:MFS family permease